MDNHFLLASVISVKTRQKEREKRKLERSDEEENTAWPYVGNKRSNTNRIGWQLVIGPVGRELSVYGTLQWSHRTDSPLRNRRLSAGQHTARGFTVRGTWVFRFKRVVHTRLGDLVYREGSSLGGIMTWMMFRTLEEFRAVRK